ncbi:MAG: response regulator [Acidimicrobiia bacterium]|jgi:signal transduction histidine kinase
MTVVSALDVVVVDDDPDGRRATLRVLARAGLSATGADSAETGWRLVREYQPRLVLLNVVLPDHSGYEVLRRIRDDPALVDVGVVMLSSVRTPEDRTDGLASGADDHIERPVASNELLARVRANLRQTDLVHRLRASEERFRSLITQQADAVLALARDGTVRFSNPAAEALFGVPAGALDGTPFGAPLPGAGETEVEIRRDDGTTLHAEMRVAESEWDGEPAWIVALRDVSARLALEEQLRRSQRLEAVGSLTAGIAHDFNNLLAVILGASEDLREFAESADVRSLAEMIGIAAARGADLTQRLLAVARRQLLIPGPVDVGALLADLEPILQRTLGGLVSVEITVDPMPWSVLVDRGGLESALLNLCSNARDAMPGGGRIRIETANVEYGSADPTRPEDLEVGPYVLLSVSDDGEGIPPENMEKLYEPFFTTKPHGEGTGLGLPMVFGFAKQSGGHLAVASEVGRGTRVTLFLPRAEPAVVEVPDAGPTVDRPRQGDLRLLVVDDDDLVRRILVRQLEHLGYRILAVGDAREALDALDANDDIALLLTDIRLGGGMDGYGLAARARERRPDLRVVFMSGLAREGLAPDEIPDDPVLGKPFRQADLAAVLASALA